MDDRYYAVIMAGGRGERFWPLSTRLHPKQTLTIFGGTSLLEQAVKRLDGFIPAERILVVTGAQLVEPLRDQARVLPPANFIAEPIGRDTAAACALGTLVVRKRCPEAVVCMLSSDHIMRDPARFQRTLATGFAHAALSGDIVTIGLEPRFPSTGFGYIARGDRVAEHEGIPVFKARGFVEKPDAATAQRYLEAGTYFWNGGMFIWRVTTFMDALARNCPNLSAMCHRLDAVVGTAAFASRLEREYSQIERVSVDFAVMEKVHNIAVVPGRFPWFDVGSWPSLQDHFEANSDGNVVVGEGRCRAAENNIVVSKDRLTALLGVRDLIVVQAPGATLVCHRDHAQQVKELVAMLAAEGRYEDLL